MDPEKRAACGGCGNQIQPWITTCPACGASTHYPSEELSLSAEVAPAITPEISWIDIPLSAEEPVRAALFRHFLVARKFDLEESRRFISIRVDQADAIAKAVKPWAFDHDMPADPRSHDSLATTLHSVGEVVLETIEAHRSAIGARSIDDDEHLTAEASSEDGDGIDLR